MKVGASPQSQPHLNLACKDSEGMINSTSRDSADTLLGAVEQFSLCRIGASHIHWICFLLVGLLIVAHPHELTGGLAEKPAVCHQQHDKCGQTLMPLTQFKNKLP